MITNLCKKLLVTKLSSTIAFQLNTEHKGDVEEAANTDFTNFHWSPENMVKCRPILLTTKFFPPIVKHKNYQKQTNRCGTIPFGICQGL